jgi:hypothetical protein
MPAGRRYFKKGNRSRVEGDQGIRRVQKFAEGNDRAQMLAALKQLGFQSDIPDSVPTLVIAELLAALKKCRPRSPAHP